MKDKTISPHWLYLLVTFFLWSGQTFASGIPDQTLWYSVEYTGQNAGKLEVRIKNEEDRLTVTTISHLSTLAKMFLDAQTSETLFKLKKDGYTLIQGKDYLQQNNELVRQFNIKRKKKFISFLSGEKIDISPRDIFEADSFPIVLMTSEIERMAGQKIYAVSGKRARQYQYQKPQKTQIEVNGEQTAVWEVVRNRVDQPDNTVSFWLDQKNHHIPVKIVTDKKGKKTILTLTK